MAAAYRREHTARFSSRPHPIRPGAVDAQIFRSGAFDHDDRGTAVEWAFSSAHVSIIILAGIPAGICICLVLRMIEGSSVSNSARLPSARLANHL